MDYGLGLVLSFTDNASVGINNAVNSLNQLTSVAEGASASLDKMASLSALSIVSDKLGTSFLNMGRNIVSAFSGAITELNNVGQTLMYAEMQFDKLYEGSETTGKDVLNNIQDYAKRSVFEFEDLIPSVVMLKANGIEAFDAIGKSIEGADRNLMDYAADLAAFNPQMRNMYGTGIQAAMGALNEYIAEGNARSLKSGASLDITGILGEDKGKTIEERTDQIVRLMEKLNMVGMVSSMEGRPQQMLSNMGDVLFDLKGRIANSGVYEEFSKLIGIVAEFVFSLTDSELQSIADTVGSALSSIMKPIGALLTKLVSFASTLKDLLIQNPKLAKFATIVVAIGGALAVVMGVILKATSAFSGLSLMMLTLNSNMGKIGGLIRTGSLKVISSLLPLIATIGLLAFAWKIDFAGIQTNTKEFVGNVVTSFKTAKSAISGSVEEMTSILDDLRNKGDFFSNITIGIMKLGIFFRALTDGWSDNTLSEDNFKKAEELGILPLIEAILDLKYRFDFFKQGFIDGWREIGERVKTAISGFLDNIKGTFLESMIDKLTEFLQKLSSGDTQAWYDFGQSFADFTAKAVAFWAVFKVVGSVLSKIASVITFISGIGKIIKSVVTFVKGLKIVKFFTTLVNSIGTVLGAIGSVVTGILGLFGVVVSIPTWVVGAITVAVVAIVALVVKYWDEISAFLSKIGQWIYDNVIAPVADFFVGLWNGIKEGVSTVVNAIKDFFSTIASWIYNSVIMPVVNFFMTYIYPFIEKIVEIVMKVLEIIYALIRVAVEWVYNNVIVPVANFFVQLFNDIVNIIKTVVSWIDTNVIQPIATFFTNLWNDIVIGVQNFVDTVTQIFKTIISWIDTNVITPIATLFQNLWASIQSAFQVVVNTVEAVFKSVVNKVFGFIGGIINGIIKGINTAIGVINAIPGVSITKITELDIPQLAQGGVVDRPTTALIGEAGTEAVVPLENNTQWLGKLASMLVEEVRDIRPAHHYSSNSSNGSKGAQLLSSTVNNNNTVGGNTDNSVVFNSGAIQINCQNASDEEAQRMAKKIMEYINRRREIDSMMNYA